MMNYTIYQLFGLVIIGVGLFFCFATVSGIIRFPDVYTRIHAGTKCLVLGAVFICIGAAVYIWSPFESMKILLVGLFFLITNPLSTHSIARASYKRGIALPTLVTDEYENYSNLNKEERGVDNSD